jgi:hypothetical protein
MSGRFRAQKLEKSTDTNGIAFEHGVPEIVEQHHCSRVREQVKLSGQDVFVALERRGLFATRRVQLLRRHVSHIAAADGCPVHRRDVDPPDEPRSAVTPTGNPARTISLIENLIESLSIFPFTSLLMVGWGELATDV